MLLVLLLRWLTASQEITCKKKKAFKKTLRDWFSKSEQHHKWCSFDIIVSVQKSGEEMRLRFLKRPA